MHCAAAAANFFLSAAWNDQHNYVVVVAIGGQWWCTHTHWVCLYRLCLDCQCLSFASSEISPKWESEQVLEWNRAHVIVHCEQPHHDFYRKISFRIWNENVRRANCDRAWRGSSHNGHVWAKNYADYSKSNQCHLHRRPMLCCCHFFLIRIDWFLQQNRPLAYVAAELHNRSNGSNDRNASVEGDFHTLLLDYITHYHNHPCYFMFMVCV